MIDCEVRIFNQFHKAVSEYCANGRVLSTPLIAPTAFPAATLYELDNTTVEARQSSYSGEEYAEVTYQMDTYAQTKSECRKVFAAGDDAMLKMNFNRLSGRVTFQMDNPKTFRMTARYHAVVDRNGNIYRNA